MEYLWFGTGAGRSSSSDVDGRFYQNEDFGLVAALADKVDAGWLQIICVDSVDAESWYNRQAHPATAPAATTTTTATSGTRCSAHHREDGGQHRRLRRVLRALPCRERRRAARRLVTKRSASRHLSHGAVSRRLLGRDLLLPLPPAYIPNMDDGWCGRLRQVVVRRDGRARLAHRREPRLRRHLWRKNIGAQPSSGPASSATTGRSGTTRSGDSSSRHRLLTEAISLSV